MPLSENHGVNAPMISLFQVEHGAEMVSDISEARRHLQEAHRAIGWLERDIDKIHCRLDKLQAEHDELEIFTTILLGGMILALLVPYVWVVGAVSAASAVLLLWPTLSRYWAVVRAWAAVWVVQPVREALSLYRPGGDGGDEH